MEFKTDMSYLAFWPRVSVWNLRRKEGFVFLKIELAYKYIIFNKTFRHNITTFQHLQAICLVLVSISSRTVYFKFHFWKQFQGFLTASWIFDKCNEMTDDRYLPLCLIKMQSHLPKGKIIRWKYRRKIKKTC